MRTIHKVAIMANSVRGDAYRIPLHLPRGSRPLTIQPQGGRLCLWYEVETDEVDKGSLDWPYYELLCVGTGFGKVPDTASYFCTAQADGMTWHFYLPTLTAEVKRAIPSSYFGHVGPSPVRLDGGGRSA